MADSPRYYRVSPKFWSSAERLGWDEETRLLALYILTCDHRTTEGLFRLPKQYILADLEWSAQRLAQPFAKLCADDFIDYDDDAKVILIVKALAYQSPSNPNGVTAAIRALSMVPSNRLDSRFYELSQRYSERLAEALPERFTQPIGHPPALAPALALTPQPSADADRVTSEFDQFWDAYPRGQAGKTGGDGPRKPSLQKWRRLSDDERAACLVAVKHYADHISRPDSPHAAHAITWLNQERWEMWQEPAGGNNGTPSRTSKAVYL